MKRVFLAFLLVLSLAGCGGNAVYGQVPQKTVSVSYTWTAPATGCSTSTPCTYVLSTLTVANGTASCPAATGSNYTPVNESAPVSQTSYVYASPTLGTSMCAIVQAYNGLYSNASAPSNVVVIPTQPGVTGPPTGSETSAALVKPALPPSISGSGQKQLAMSVRGAVIP